MSFPKVRSKTLAELTGSINDISLNTSSYHVVEYLSIDKSCNILVLVVSHQEMALCIANRGAWNQMAYEVLGFPTAQLVIVWFFL